MSANLNVLVSNVFLYVVSVHLMERVISDFTERSIRTRVGQRVVKPSADGNSMPFEIALSNDDLPDDVSPITAICGSLT